MKTYRHPIVAFLLFTVSIPSAVFAQEDGSSEIFVTGERPLDRASIQDAVSEMLDEQHFDVPLPRFHDPVCLSVSGLGDAASSQVRDRVIENAREAGVLVAEEGCRANALVLIVDDPASLVAQMQKRLPRLIPPAERRRLDAEFARGERVLVWHNEETRGPEGENLRISTTAPGMPIAGGTGGLGAETRINSHGRARRVGAVNSRAIVNGVVVLDIEQLVGMDLDRVADFATMRLLAPGMRADTVKQYPADASEASKAQSVLDPFVAGQGADRMTRFDRAWLRALYELTPNSPSTRLAGAVARAYADDVN